MYIIKVIALSPLIIVGLAYICDWCHNLYIGRPHEMVINREKAMVCNSCIWWFEKLSEANEKMVHSVRRKTYKLKEIQKKTSNNVTYRVDAC